MPEPHKEADRRTCTKCLIEQPIENFNFQNAKKGTRSSWCKKCFNAYQRERWYIQTHSDPPRIKLYGLQREKAEHPRHKIRSKLFELKSEMGCSLCDETFHQCLDFHHLNPDEKYMEVSSMVTGIFLWEEVLDEIDQCILICSNCHRKVHAGVISLLPRIIKSPKPPPKRRARRIIIENKLKIKKLKLQMPCPCCGEDSVECLEFHHEDPSNKTAEVAKLLRESSRWETISLEIDKCICVCSNCHRKIHAKLIKIPDNWQQGRPIQNGEKMESVLSATAPQ